MSGTTTNSTRQRYGALLAAALRLLRTETGAPAFPPQSGADVRRVRRDVDMVARLLTGSAYHLGSQAVGLPALVGQAAC